MSDVIILIKLIKDKKKIDNHKAGFERTDLVNHNKYYYGTRIT